MNDDFYDLDMRNVQKIHIALMALSLMTAKSLPQQKETVVALIVNMLVEGE